MIRAPYAVYDNRFATGYYRLLPDGRLLWGGRISTQEQPRDLAGLMRRDLALVYPQLADVAVDHAWSGRMGFARHKMPLIRELAPGLWVNSCFGGHGLNTTTLGGELVASAIARGRPALAAPGPVRAALGRRRPRPAGGPGDLRPRPDPGRRPRLAGPAEVEAAAHAGLNDVSFLTAATGRRHYFSPLLRRVGYAIRKSAGGRARSVGRGRLCRACL